MKILAFSDIHRNLDATRDIVAASGQADLVIGAGDFATHHKGLTDVLDLLAPIAGKLVLVPGNHETETALREAAVAPVLHGQMLERDGLRILGLGAAVPPLPPLPWRSFDLEEDAAAEMLAAFSAADILISHSPPKGIADQVRGLGSIGSEAVREAVERIKPRLVLCGHIHDCWGESGQIGDSRVFNLGPRANWFEI